MPLNYHTTKNFLLRCLTGKNPGHEIGTGFEALGEDIDALLTERLLTARVRIGKVTAQSGELLEIPGGEVTLPSATIASQIVGVINGSTLSAKTTVKTNGTDAIFGDFVAGATSVKLAPYQHVLLISSEKAWFIVAGEPERGGLVETKPSAAEVHTGIRPSATRPALVVVFATNGSEVSDIEVEGKLCGLIKGSSSTVVPVPAGATWKSFAEMSTTNFTVQTLLS